ncbi:ribbon-helix-helix protein, CopG family [Ferrimicrobium sp.]|uniref:ribbon-helix-helix protein, CopG family n=1 Tax=Ferrimicrobium sp. TaxID=2926050 RepID=UPI00262613DD|nr:ribbon-helix-helix protein, CopG family [Ferrimicrobium sp.]
MGKNFTLRLSDDEAADVQALARAEGLSMNETVRRALVEAVAVRRADPEFKSRIQKIIDEDRELLERLAR